MSKNISIYTCILFLFIGMTFRGMTQEPVPEPVNTPFKPGEVLKFRFYYDAWLTGKVTAGIGIAEVKAPDKKFSGRPVYHYDTEGSSKGLFRLFYKVYDQFDSYVDRETLAPYLLIRRTREGGYEKDDEYHFNHDRNYVVTRTDSMDIPPFTQDFVSAVYYARTFRTDTLDIGDRLYVDFFLDDSVYTSAIIYEGKEIVDIKLGKFRCLRFKPMMAVGEVFTERYPMTLWISDDKNHVPVLAKSAVYVGNLKMELMEYENLANPLTSVIELYE